MGLCSAPGFIDGVYIIFFFVLSMTQKHASGKSRCACEKIAHHFFFRAPFCSVTQGNPYHTSKKHGAVAADVLNLDHFRPQKRTDPNVKFPQIRMKKIIFELLPTVPSRQIGFRRRKKRTKSQKSRFGSNCVDIPRNEPPRFFFGGPFNCSSTSW